MTHSGRLFFIDESRRRIVPINLPILYDIGLAINSKDIDIVLDKSKTYAEYVKNAHEAFPYIYINGVRVMNYDLSEINNTSATNIANKFIVLHYDNCNDIMPITLNVLEKEGAPAKGASILEKTYQAVKAWLPFTTAVAPDDNFCVRENDPSHQL